MKKEILSEVSRLEKFSLSVTKNVGSIPSLIFHTIAFVGIFSLQFFGFSFDQIMLILTTIVSLEAIYLSIFIQMTVNRHTKTLSEVSEDMEEISEDVEDIQEDVKEMSDDVEEISEDVEHIQKHVKDIQEDVEEISEDVEGIEKEVKEIGTDVDEISEDVEDISEEMAADETEEEKEKAKQVTDMKNIEGTLRELLKAVEQMKK